MTKTQLNLGIELNMKIEALQEARAKYKEGFDIVSSDEEENVELGLDDTRSYFVDFPKEEIQKLFEYRIIQIDYQLEELNTKFKQL